MSHVPVLLDESIDALAITAGDTVVDATLGAAGHSLAIVKRFGRDVRIVGFDLDGAAIASASAALTEAGADFVPIQANFRTMQDSLARIGILEIDAALFDLGVSSMELGQSGRGFSFKYDEPLLMTLTNPVTEDTLTAAEVVNGMREEDLANVIYEYGEERYSRQIAKAICMARRTARIETSAELADIIARAVPAGYRNGRINPATRTFQALRIYVNDELKAAEDGVRAAWHVLNPGGRIAVITFHSLEDRVIKNLFKSLVAEGGTLVSKKPIVPSRAEVVANPRSRSAKLRIIEKN